MAMGEQPADKEVEEAAGGGKKEEAPAIILAVELHCTGCAKRIKRCILRCRGVEGVEVDMGGNQVTVKVKVKGTVDPQALCARLHKKTMRKATVVSPPEPADKPEPPPPPETRTMELRVNMHCQPCADLLLKRILKMPGVETAEADLSAGMLTVTGTMTADKIVEYLHRRTGKLATVLPPPDPPKPPEPEEQPQAAAGETKPPEDEGQKKEDKPAPAAEADKKPAEEAADKGKEKQEEGVAVVDGFPPEEMMKRLAYWPYAAAGYKQYPATAEEVMMARRMATMNLMPQPAMMPQWMPPPPPPPPPPVYYSSSYMVERPAPAMQLFSDENPNACVIS